ncbi:hypothetical protein PPERSA_12007 [Pseudocohnilembus persalinus]|uniref:Uncharacterized protein n=1 Tax=Pseudocohnilembus persalinus TaxID=266149 RepID=A0A0V0QKB8_PSEPJ|nr:hypothetical protein PPERSA_12007 [Pseudocohnilembus persalinus]|eukprot:KRX02667.1 hypothetical protein PPERSA_12007 [Pseudocohnilembus persalinus]
MKNQPEQKKIKQIQQENKTFLGRLVKIQNRKEFQLLPKGFKPNPNQEYLEKFIQHKKVEQKFKSQRSRTVDVTNQNQRQPLKNHNNNSKISKADQNINKSLAIQQNEKINIQQEINSNSYSPDQKLSVYLNASNYGSNQYQKSQESQINTNLKPKQYDSNTIDTHTIYNQNKSNENFENGNIERKKGQLDSSKQFEKLPESLKQDYIQFLENNRHKIYTNKTQRNKKEKEIQQQNRKLVGRIINQKSNYSKDTLEKQFQKHQQNLNIRRNTAFHKTELVHKMLKQNNLRIPKITQMQKENYKSIQHESNQEKKKSNKKLYSSKNSPSRRQAQTERRQTEAASAQIQRLIQNGQVLKNEDIDKINEILNSYNDNQKAQQTEESEKEKENYSSIQEEQFQSQQNQQMFSPKQIQSNKENQEQQQQQDTNNSSNIMEQNNNLYQKQPDELDIENNKQDDKYIKKEKCQNQNKGEKNENQQNKEQDEEEQNQIVEEINGVFNSQNDSKIFYLQEQIDNTSQIEVQQNGNKVNNQSGQKSIYKSILKENKEKILVQDQKQNINNVQDNI